MKYLSLPQLVLEFNGIPRRDEISLAVTAASTPSIQDRGRNKYDLIQTGEALVKYYRGLAKRNMDKHLKRPRAAVTQYLINANSYAKKADMISTLLEEMKET